MFSPRTLLAVAVAPLAVVAAPVPKPATDAKFKKLFGAGELPEQKGEFKLAGGTLTVAFPEKDWVGDTFRPHKCPHTALEVTGDFELTVAVRTTGPKVPPDHRRQRELGGGVAVWDATAKEPSPVFVRRHFFEKGKGRGNDVTPWWEVTEAHFPGAVHLHGDDEHADPTTTQHVRMARAGTTLTFSVSTDGKEWKRLGSREVGLPKGVSVGVWAYNCTGGPGDVVFEGFTLTRPE